MLSFLVGGGDDNEGGSSSNRVASGSELPDAGLSSAPPHGHRVLVSLKRRVYFPGDEMLISVAVTRGTHGARAIAGAESLVVGVWLVGKLLGDASVGAASVATAAAAAPGATPATSSSSDPMAADQHRHSYHNRLSVAPDGSRLLFSSPVVQFNCPADSASNLFTVQMHVPLRVPPTFRGQSCKYFYSVCANVSVPAPAGRPAAVASGQLLFRVLNPAASLARLSVVPVIRSYDYGIKLINSVAASVDAEPSGVDGRGPAPTRPATGAHRGPPVRQTEGRSRANHRHRGQHRSRRQQLHVEPGVGSGGGGGGGGGGEDDELWHYYRSIQAEQRSNQLQSRLQHEFMRCSRPLSVDISKEAAHLTAFSVNGTAFRLGDVIHGCFDFSRAQSCSCLQVSVSLELEERLEVAIGDDEAWAPAPLLGTGNEPGPAARRAPSPSLFSAAAGADWPAHGAATGPLPHVTDMDGLVGGLGPGGPGPPGGAPSPSSGGRRRFADVHQKIVAEAHLVTACSQFASFSFEIPPNSSQSFATDHVMVSWVLKFEFVTVRSGRPTGAGLASPPVESLSWSMPIRVLVPELPPEFYFESAGEIELLL